MLRPVTERPRRVRRIVLAIVGSVALAGLATGGWVASGLLPIGTGIVAKSVCSDVFNAKRSSKDLLDDEVPQASFVGFEVDAEAKTVTASAWGLASRTAAHRPGLGCALTIGTDPDSLRADGFEPPHAPLEAAPWPRGEGAETRPDPEGLDRDALEAAIDGVFGQDPPFDDDDSGRPLNTRAVVVIHRGRLLSERYAPGFDAATPQLGWSMTKSITSALVGLLVGRGEIDVEGPVGFASWSSADDPRRDITWDHLLRMSSGLAFDEAYGGRSEATRMLFDSHDGSRLALEQPLAHPVDEHWAYSSGTTNLLMRRMRELFDDDDAYHRFPHVALFEPIGMRSAVLETDPSGTFVGSSFMYATPRDWARFGQLYLQDGEWEGERLLSEGWVARSVTPTPTHPTRGYGMQWWLNAAEDPDDRPMPSVPADAYFASGFQGQTVLVVPSRAAVIVRMGMTNGPHYPQDRLMREILAALPE